MSPVLTHQWLRQGLTYSRWPISDSSLVLFLKQETETVQNLQCHQWHQAEPTGKRKGQVPIQSSPQPRKAGALLSHNCYPAEESGHMWGHLCTILATKSYCVSGFITQAVCSRAILQNSSVMRQRRMAEGRGAYGRARLLWFTASHFNRHCFPNGQLGN